MRTLVTGATGFLGRQLLRRLDRPVVLSRNPERAERELAEFGVRAFAWDADEAFAEVSVVFHLAGEPVAEGRWTAAKKTRIRDSRVLGTRTLIEKLCRSAEKPRVLISASAVGYYGARGDEVLSESVPAGTGFLAEVCAAWEEESQAAAQAGIRVINPRIGIVLGRDGGALARMLTPFRFGLGSPLGSGRQWMSWIHQDDLVDLLLFAAANETVRGPVNATAPHPVTNREFTATLGRVLRRPTLLPAVPGFVLRAALGEFAQVLLGSQRAVPQAACDAGFVFRFADLESALRDLCSRR